MTLITAAPRSAGAAAPLAWADCGNGLGCATLAVPLDHTHPGGPTIDLALANLPATDPAHRIGTIVVGAPGSSSGVALLRSAGDVLFSPAVRARFDLVSFDRRGVGGSAPVRCFDTAAEENALISSLVSFPVGKDEVATLGDQYADYARHCVSRNAALLPHLSSTDVARDLDLIRAAVGDYRLTYVGYSWSAYVGAIYANLFPDRVRAVVYDGPQYAPDFGSGPAGTVPFVRTGADLAAEESLKSFLAVCRRAGADRCVFAAGGDPAAKYETILDRLRRGPLTAPLPGWPAEFSLDDGLALTVFGLFSGDSYPGLAADLQTLYAAATGTAAGSPAARTTAAEAYDNWFDAFSAMACADLERPAGVIATERAADRQARISPHFGRYYAWYVGQCATWPGPSPDRHTSGWVPAGAATRGLVVGMRYDPIAHYAGVARFAALLRTGLVTVADGRGHLSIGQSGCAREAVSTYLMTAPKVPPSAACGADRQPF